MRLIFSFHNSNTYWLHIFLSGQYSSFSAYTLLLLVTIYLFSRGYFHDYHYIMLGRARASTRSLAWQADRIDYYMYHIRYQNFKLRFSHFQNGIWYAFAFAVMSLIISSYFFTLSLCIISLIFFLFHDTAYVSRRDFSDFLLFLFLFISFRLGNTAVLRHYLLCELLLDILSSLYFHVLHIFFIFHFTTGHAWEVWYHGYFYFRHAWYLYIFVFIAQKVLEVLNEAGFLYFSPFHYKSWHSCQAFRFLLRPTEKHFGLFLKELSCKLAWKPWLKFIISIGCIFRLMNFGVLQWVMSYFIFFHRKLRFLFRASFIWGLEISKVPSLPLDRDILFYWPISLLYAFLGHILGEQ